LTIAVAQLPEPITVTSAIPGSFIMCYLCKGNKKAVGNIPAASVNESEYMVFRKLPFMYTACT